MKLLLDFAPLAIFFVVYKTQGLMSATAALMIATLVSVAITYMQTRKLSPAPVITAVIIAVAVFNMFGSDTHPLFWN